MKLLCCYLLMLLCCYLQNLCASTDDAAASLACQVRQQHNSEQTATWTSMFSQPHTKRYLQLMSMFFLQFVGFSGFLYLKIGISHGTVGTRNPGPDTGI